MLDYDAFEKYMTKLKEFDVLCNKLYSLGFGGEPLWEYMGIIEELLAKLIDDKFDWISWYCWECAFGTNADLFPDEDRGLSALSYEWLYNKIKECSDVE